MADKKIKVDAKAETVENEKTKKQKEEAAAIRKKKAEAEETAKKERQKKEEEKKKKEEEKKKQEEEQTVSEPVIETTDNTKEQLIAAGSGVVTALLDKKTKCKWKDLLIGFVIGLVCGGLLVYVLFGQSQNVLTTNPGAAEEHDLVIEENLIGYTAADFQDAILGAVSEHQELIVMEQALSIPVTITKAGLGNLAVFSKVKSATFCGSGVYTVDLSAIDSEHIIYEEDKKNITILIPHAALQYINPDLEGTEFQDTQKGWLAFGDLKLTLEDQNELEIAVRDAMQERLVQDDLMKQADEFAILKTWEIFQPLVTVISPEFTVTMEFTE